MKTAYIPRHDDPEWLKKARVELNVRRGEERVDLVVGSLIELGDIIEKAKTK